MSASCHRGATLQALHLSRFRGESEASIAESGVHSAQRAHISGPVATAISKNP